MARDVKNAAMAQASQAEQNNQLLSGQQQQQNSQLQQTYQNMLNTGFANPTEQNAVTQATMGSLGGTYDALMNSAKMNAARTRNDQALSANLDKLAQTEGSQGAQIAANNVAQGAREGLGGQSSLYNTNVNLLSRTLGLPAQYLQIAGANSPKTGFGLNYGPFSFSASS